MIERFWIALLAKVKSYINIVKYVVLGVALIGWLVYMGFAFWCRFGDEESVRMLGIPLMLLVLEQSNFYLLVHTRNSMEQTELISIRMELHVTHSEEFEDS